jgi:hypothetical protein
VSTDREMQNGAGGHLDIFGTPGLVEAAMQKAVRQALRRHKLLGESVAVSDEHGKVVILSPDEIPDFPEDA